MAVEKVYKCDLCGAQVSRDLLRVARIGTPDDRPEDATRVDVGPECGGRPVEDLMDTAGRLNGE